MIANAQGVTFMPIEGHVTGLIGYMLGDPAARLAVVVDPPLGGTELILALLAECAQRLSMVLRTHVHANDREGDGCVALCERTGATLVVGHAPHSHASTGVCAVHHGDMLTFGNETLRVLATPGHTMDSVSYLWRDRLMCGDMLEFGRGSLEDDQSGPALQYDSLTRHLFSLPEQTLIFPAHPLKGRRVALLSELKSRLTPMLGAGRDAFIASMALRRTAGG